MPTHVALLRGINVGGVRVAMPALREVVASLGHTDVSTYIQTGNVLFTARGSSTAKMSAALRSALAEALGVKADVVVLSCGELRQVATDNPYRDEPNPKYVHAVFLPDEAPPGAEARIAAAQQRAAERGSRDEAQLVGRTLFLHTPDGFGRSELATLLLGRSSSPVAGGTARNWATVSKLLDLCGA